MSLRMWRKSGPEISVEGRRGYFDVSYGDESPSQKLDVYLPEGEGPFPAIISIHGGGYVACDKRQKEMITPMLAGLKRGFAVIGLNYRLAGESGFPEPVRDIKRAVRFIKAHGEEWNICPERLAAWGGSAGGYMTLMGCLCANETYFDSETDPNREADAGLAAGVAWYPQTDFGSADEELEINSVINRFLRTGDRNDNGKSNGTSNGTSSGTGDVNEKEYEPAFPLMEEHCFPFHNLDDGVCALFLGANPDSGEPVVEKASPINHIHENMPPMFIQHGSGDEILPMQQSIRFARKANKVCREERVRLEIIPGAIHSSLLFETEENLEKVFCFLEEALLK